MTRPYVQTRRDPFDVNDALHEQRLARARLANEPVDPLATLRDIAEWAERIDRYLSNGGQFPREWTKVRGSA